MKIRSSVLPDYTEIRQRQESLLKHHQRLVEITHKPLKKQSLNLISIKKTVPYSEITRKIDIQKTNRLLLSKLVHINNRKINKTLKSKSLENFKGCNQYKRKEHQKKINNENRFNAKKVASLKPHINKNIFDKEFMEKKKYLGMMSRKHVIPYAYNVAYLPSVKKVNKINKNESCTPTYTSRKRFNCKTFQPKSKSVAGVNKKAINSLQDNEIYEDDFNE